jgi:light-regulated signal transduction histidine kinase (bacteriophytochrome)
MVATISQRNAAARDQVYISIALNIFQGLLVLGFAALLIRQVGSLEKRSVELGQATDEIRLLNSELEERVSQRTAQLEAANQELEAFSYSVSHDLRAPLKTINGFSHLLERTVTGNVSEKGQHYLNRIRAGTRQMGELIDGLLSLAQLSRDKLQFSEVDLAGIARSIGKECRERDPERQAQILVQETMQARGDRRLLSVILQNLLGNAWKFTSRVEMARIEVGSQPQEAGETVYFVKDNGAGFDMAYAEKLFGTFQRLHSPADFAGTGIGLATVKRVIDRHGGRVWAQSKEGEGTVFFFTLGTAGSAL